LAKGVAGIRQYNQFIALMDNWDFMQENLETVADSEGTLTEQAEIYSQGWEAARDRLKSSFEGLWNDLVPKEFIVDFTNAMSDVVSVFDEVLEGFGGLEMVLLVIANIALNKLGPALTTGINNAATKF
jgi:hypothetical protein